MTLRIEDLGVFCGGNWLNNARFLRSLPRHHPGAFAIESVAHDVYATAQA